MPPGKLAPKLYRDLLAFDPIKGKPNVLSDHPTVVGCRPILAPLPGSCKHDYTIKTEQSVCSPLDLRQVEGAQYVVAVICKKCRIHASVYIDLRSSKIPCPSSESPLHHFVRVSDHDIITTERIQYAWKCTFPECSARLLVGYRLPRLTEDDFHVLTAPELLKSRYDALVQVDPEREGIRVATPMDPLFRLRRYIKDSLQPDQTRWQFPANNKRFQEAFGIEGRDCSQLLERYGFKYANGTWNLPKAPSVSDRLNADGITLREKCEDVTYELLAYMYKIASEQKLENPAAREEWASANRDLEIVLSAHEYQRYVSARRTGAPDDTIPYFHSLGAVPDLSDSLIEYAYDRQVACDPQQQAYYLECLQVITEIRNTEQLQMKVATLQSTGLYSRRDLALAYRQLNITPTEAIELSDQRVLERYQAQQGDLGQQAQEEARASLYKVGMARNSTLLINASQQNVDTYEAALAWLGSGVDKNTPDESLLAVVAIKLNESSSNNEIVQKAISTIAAARKSNMLNNWLLTGRSDGWTMSVDEALRHLNIEQPFDTIDKSILPALFDSARQDRPGETTNKAIATIEQAVAAEVGNGVHTPETWPVGLTSHGNTCYLNSLLQYYFSIKPLRNIILSYDDYRLDTEAHPEKNERVGQRKISMVEIKGGQRFAAGLKELFVRMIQSPDSAVRPDEDLVCRAFLEPKDYAFLASKIGDPEVAISDELSATNDNSVAATQVLTDSDIATSPVKERRVSNSSSTTLLASNDGENVDTPMRNNETPPTPPLSPNLQGDAKPAPPLPPRRFSTTKEEALSKAEENARQQQDVTEVHDGIMFRLRSGMKARDKDADEEQMDALRDLFSIGMIETTVNGADETTKKLADTSIQLDVPYESTDIYSALDAVFDLQAYAENPSLKSFKSISSLPPLLQINIPRIGFDKNRAGGAVYKSNECVRLHDELYLDRYYEGYQRVLLPKRKQCWQWREKLRLLQQEKKVLSRTTESLGLDAPSAMAESAKYLAGLDSVNNDLRSIGIEPIEADGEVTETLLHDSQTQAERLYMLDSEIETLQRQISAQFVDAKDIVYRLAAVFFHRGGPGHGHYWIYIHDFQSDVWRSYNDERVEEFKNMDDIFEAKTWQQGTPTYAVYVVADKLDTIQAVCRDPEKAPTPEYAAPPPLETVAEDVLMEQDAFQGEVPIAIEPGSITKDGEQSWDVNRRSGLWRLGLSTVYDPQLLLSPLNSTDSTCSLASPTSPKRPRSLRSYDGEVPSSPPKLQRYGDVTIYEPQVTGLEYIEGVAPLMFEVDSE